MDNGCQVRERLESAADQSGRDVLRLHCTGLFHYMDLWVGGHADPVSLPLLFHVNSYSLAACMTAYLYE